MATVRLLKDRKATIDGKDVVQKKGETVSVPFEKGRSLVAAGEAEYLAQPAAKSKPNESGGATVPASVFADAVKKHTQAASASADRIAYLEGELAKVIAERDELLAKPADKAADAKK